MTTRRDFIKDSIKLLGSGLPCLAFANPTMAKSPSKPFNFVFILVDDLGWNDLGCYGSSFYDTPNLDKFAQTGMRFTDGYAACPVCSPTRAAIMTGKHPVRVDITDWIPGRKVLDRRLLSVEDSHQLSLSETTIAETMKSNGYKTFFAGKWHLGDKGYFPQDQGFDINKGGFHVGSPRGGYYSPYKNPELENGPEGEYLPDRLTNESISFLEQNKDDPFLLYLSFYTVHTPIQACKRHLPKYQSKADALPETEDPAFKPEHEGFTKQRQDGAEYASMVHAMDENVGRLLDKLDQLQLNDNTVVIFTSDNGGLSTLPREWAPTSLLPLRAGKGWCYEGGIRVPAIIRVPGLTKAGSVSSEPITSMDYYPTMLQLAGLDALPKQHCDGASLVPLLKGKQSIERDALYWHYPHYHGSAWTPGAAIRCGDWKLIEFYDYEKVELYNLSKDIGEKNNLSKKMPDKTQELLQMLHTWQKKMKAKMPQPNPDYKKP
jgi:arylsulfatase A-like enzyme